MGVRIGGGIGPFRASVGLRAPRGSSSGCLSLLLVSAAITAVSAWPWFLGTYLATKQGAVKGSTGYNLAGWIPEGAWIAFVLIALVMRASGNARRNAERAAAAAQQRAALAQHRARMRQVATPWYDPEAGHYTHNTCTIAHRSEGSALRCRSKV